jgi:hypothetical protein
MSWAGSRPRAGVYAIRTIGALVLQGRGVDRGLRFVFDGQVLPVTRSIFQAPSSVFTTAPVTVYRGESA